jgi:hypothetical protein
MGNEKQRKTFLSYSRANKDFAIKLAKELKSEGFYVWLDQLDIPAGSRWDTEVEKALEECEIFMIILTKASINSENVLDEIGYAVDNSKRFLPVMLETCNVPLRLRRFQYVDFTTKNFDDGVESAKELLRNLIAQTTMPRGEIPAESQDQMAQTEADRLVAQKVEAELLALIKVETERKAKEEADRLAAQEAEEERLWELQKAETAAKAEADRLTKQKAEDERLAKAKAETERKAKEEADRLWKAQKTERAAKADAERLAQAKTETERKAKEEANRLAMQKAEAERLAQAKAETERNAKQEADRLAKQKAEGERLAKAKAETERKAKEEADRRAKEKVTPVEAMPAVMNAETVSAATAQKKPVSKGLVIGIVAVVVLCIAGIGFSVISKFGISATPVPPNITNAHMASDVDDAKQSNVYSPSDKTFYCFLDLSNAPATTVLKGVWTLVFAEGYDPNSEIDTAEITGGDNNYHFYLDRSADPWPVGKYKIDLYVDNNLAQTIEFDVK